MICIDPGHGGEDSGTVVNGYQEKNINLEMCKIIESMLIHDNIEYITTRNHNNTVQLSERANKANSAGVDVFVSVHCNFFAASNANGSTVFHFHGSKKGENLAKKINNSIRHTNIEARGTQAANFHVLRETEMPAVLVECGFLSNEGDRRILTSHSGVYEISHRIVEGLKNYMRSGYDGD